MKRSVLLGAFALLLLTAGCAVESGYGGAYGGVYGEYPSTYYSGNVYYPAPVYRYHYYHHPYDRDHYWDRHEYYEHRRHRDYNWH